MVVVRRYGPRVAQSAQVFAGVKTPAGRVAEAARRPVYVGRAVGLGRIFEYPQVMALGQPVDRVHVAAATVKVHRQYGPRAGG